MRVTLVAPQHLAELTGPVPRQVGKSSVFCVGPVGVDALLGPEPKYSNIWGYAWASSLDYTHGLRSSKHNEMLDSLPISPTVSLHKHAYDSEYPDTEQHTHTRTHAHAHTALFGVMVNLQKFDSLNK